jgi:hypothetical protein
MESKPAAPPKPAEDLANLKITDARVGDAVSISGAGDDFGDLDFTIDRRNQYTAGEKQWIELGGMYKERRVYLEVVSDEEVEVTAVRDPNKLTIEELGLSEQDLADLDERQNTADNFYYQDKMWFYRFSKEVSLLREGQARSTGYYLWEFREEGGKRVITIRKGEGEPFTASLGTLVNPGDITVYRPS